jgi:hypothetical protein
MKQVALKQEYSDIRQNPPPVADKVTPRLQHSNMGFTEETVLQTKLLKN